MRRQPANKATVAIVGVPFDWGGSVRGARLGPEAIRLAGVGPRLKQLGYRVRDMGDLTMRRQIAARPASAPQPADKLNRLDDVIRTGEKLCAKLTGILTEGQFPLVLGGDHSIAIGTLAALKRHRRRTERSFGLIWVDAHADANTAETTPTGNIHGMPLAVALGFGDPRLTGIGGIGSPAVTPEHTVMVGVRSVDPGERRLLQSLGVTVYTTRDIERLGMHRVMERALHIAAVGTAGVHLSLDLDGLDPSEAPGVGTPVAAGLSLRECLLAMELIADAGVLVSAEFVEVNPALDHRNRTAQAAVDLIAAAFGEKLM